MLGTGTAPLQHSLQPDPVAVQLEAVRDRWARDHDPRSLRRALLAILADLDA
jgi:hypothetical protein